MKLTKTHTEEIKMDMTPMIDCVFQLILFFMLITDMTQKELEELVLPPAKAAIEDKPIPGVVRPIVNIIADGRILVKRELLFDPENDDGYKALSEYLSDMAFKMPKEPFDKENPAGPKVPANPLLIRADQSTPFHYIQKVMEICGRKGIQIWKVELAATDEASAEKLKGKG
jgi:biopolymer transport protein ExbD